MTTSTPTDLLLARIRKALAKDSGDAALAEEFAEYCEDANSRIEECEKLQMQSREGKAVKLADEEPALIEVIDALGNFRQAGEWATYCEGKSLRVAPSVDPAASASLVELYRSWGGASKFLWKKYRDAVIRRDEGMALAIASRLLKADPSDKSAREEANRILRRHFREKLTELDELVDCDDRPAAIALADGLDRLPFDDLKKGKSWTDVIAWRDAQRRSGDEKRMSSLLAALPQQQKTGDLGGVRGTVSEIRKIAKIHKFDFGEESKSALTAARKWMTDEETRRMREASSREVVERCEKELDKIESGWPTLIKSPIGEIEGARRKLTNCWKEVDKIGGGIGAELGAKVSARNRELDKTIGKRKAKRRRKVRTVAVAVTIIGCSVAYYFYAQWRGAMIVDEMAEYKRGRKAVALNRLVKSMGTYRLPIAKLAPISSDLASARTWLDREYGHKEAIEAKIAALEEETEEGFGRPIEEYYAEMEDIAMKTSEAAVDLQPGLGKEVADLRERWDLHLASYVAAQRQRRGTALDKAEALVTAGLSRLDLAARDDGKVAEVTALAEEIEDAMRAVIPPSAPKDMMVRRADELEPQVARLLRRLVAFRDAVDALAAADGYEAYQSALMLFRDGEFEGTPEQAAAGALLAFEKTKSREIGEIFVPDDPDGWAYYEANRDKDELFPKSVDVADRARLGKLGAGDEFEDLHRCVFQESPGGRTFVRYSKGPTTLRNRRVGPTRIVERSGRFYERSGFKTGKYEFKEGRGTRLLSETPCQEVAVMEEIDPEEKLMSRSQQYYRTGIIGAFDAVLSAGDAHPLFKAYLYRELGMVVTRSRAEWGTLFAPSLLRDLREVGKHLPALLSRNDWMLPGKHLEKAAILRKFYAARVGHSYSLESQINRGLVEAAIEAGFVYAGYVDIDGSKALLPSAEDAQELFGVPAPGQHARVLFRRSGDGAAAGWETVVRPTPFSPLLFFKGDRAQLLESVAAEKGLDVEKTRAMALPFFAAGSPAAEEEAAADESADPDFGVE